jgi:hypothetical protein
MDDSAVKLYFNRRADGADDGENGHEGDDTLIAHTSYGGSRICFRKGHSI